MQDTKPKNVMPIYEVLLQVIVSQEEEDNGFDVRQFLDFQEAEDVQDVKVGLPISQCLTLRFSNLLTLGY